MLQISSKEALLSNNSCSGISVNFLNAPALNRTAVKLIFPEGRIWQEFWPEKIMCDCCILPNSKVTNGSQWCKNKSMPTPGVILGIVDTLLWVESKNQYLSI